jgi:hypothetical protein
MAASFFDNALFFRFGRVTHDWGSTPTGSNLALNGASRPFLGLDMTFNPFSWLSYATLTGILEYYNSDIDIENPDNNGIKGSSKTFQNAFSIQMLTLKYKNYVAFDFGESVVWPKRWDLGYMSPVTPYFLYQNYIGDYDNLAIFLNLKGQYPSFGSLWFSLFMDEASFQSDMNVLDRTMLSWQAGGVFQLPALSFSTLTLSYTRINPYCYTHNRNKTPWYDSSNMELSYTNNGVSLGYYLPPNSDEIKVEARALATKDLWATLGYQLIRHGADFGSDAVDGSSLYSELAPNDRDYNPKLRRYFLRDGAYQWEHIVRLRLEYTLKQTPVIFYVDTGLVFSYFTDISDSKQVNDGSPHEYIVIDTSEYPKTTTILFILGVKIFR